MEMEVELLKPGSNSLQDMKESVTSNTIDLGARSKHRKENLYHSSVLPEAYNKHVVQYQYNKRNLQISYPKHTGKFFVCV